MTMTFTPASECQACGGPCLTFKGSVWGWTCGGCITLALEASAARADAEARRHRDKLAHRMLHQDDSSLRANSQRRGGGGSALPMPHHRPGADSETVMTRHQHFTREDQP